MSTKKERMEFSQFVIGNVLRRDGIITLIRNDERAINISTSRFKDGRLSLCLSLAKNTRVTALVSIADKPEVLKATKAFVKHEEELLVDLKRVIEKAFRKKAISDNFDYAASAICELLIYQNIGYTFLVNTKRDYKWLKLLSDIKTGVTYRAGGCTFGPGIPFDVKKVKFYGDRSMTHLYKGVMDITAHVTTDNMITI